MADDSSIPAPYRTFSAHKIPIANIRLIADRDLMTDKIDVRSYRDETLRSQIFRFETYFHGLPGELISIHKQWPIDWWQAVKERWFPKWFLNRFPVVYDEVNIDRQIFLAVCPHLFEDSQQTHLEWMSAEAIKNENNQNGG